MFSSRLNYLACPNGTSAKLLGASDKRWGLVLSCNNAAGVTLSNDSPVVNLKGFTLILANGLLELNVRDHGDVVQREWYAFANSAGVNVAYIEIMACDCESLEMLRDALGHRAGDKDWHKRYGTMPK